MKISLWARFLTQMPKEKKTIDEISSGKLSDDMRQKGWSQTDIDENQKLLSGEPSRPDDETDDAKATDPGKEPSNRP